MGGGSGGVGGVRGVSGVACQGQRQSCPVARRGRRWQATVAFGVRWRPTAAATYTYPGRWWRGRTSCHSASGTGLQRSTGRKVVSGVSGSQAALDQRRRTAGAVGAGPAGAAGGGDSGGGGAERCTASRARTKPAERGSLTLGRVAGGGRDRLLHVGALQRAQTGRAAVVAARWWWRRRPAVTERLQREEEVVAAAVTAGGGGGGGSAAAAAWSDAGATGQLAVAAAEAPREASGVLLTRRAAWQARPRPRPSCRRRRRRWPPWCIGFSVGLSTSASPR